MSTFPCLACGIAVRNPDPVNVETLELPAAATRTGFFDANGQPRVASYPVEVKITRCATCLQIRAAATDLLSAHHSVKGAIGDPGIARYRVELALGALDALGVTDHRIVDRWTDSATALLKLINALAVPGGLARWSTGITTKKGAAFLPPTNAERWAHLTPVQRRALNEAFVGLHVERTSKPVPVVALDDHGRPTGCALCGIGHWDALPNHAADAWVETSIDAETIGGRPAPESLDVVLCPRCDKASDLAQGIGQTAMMLSIMDYLGANLGPRFADLVPELHGLRGWAVLPAGTPPHSEPWAHVPNLEDLRVQ